MLRHPAYTRDRLRHTARRLAGLAHRDRRAVDRILMAGPTDRVDLDAARALEYRPVELGEQLGPQWATFWFRVRATVPEAWAGERVDLLWTTHSESTLWLDGRAAQGLNTGGQGHRPDAVLVARAAGGERLELELEVACNGAFGAGSRSYATVSPFLLDACSIARHDGEAAALYTDFAVLQELEADHANGLDPTWAGVLLRELNRFCNVWREDDRSSWPEAAAILRELLATPNAPVAHEVHAIGHAHIDTAWLWPIAETHRKCVRSYASALAYMERYPGYRFSCSGARHLAWMRDREPELYGRIRSAVTRGQFVPVGGTWVEPDCNLPSGESLVRQFLHGQRFFEHELGRRCNEFWNPDVFGYNGQLPQLMRGAGMTRFLTQKLSWNRFNQPPYHTFRWQGIDGSEVLTHFPPLDTYNSSATVAEVRRSARQYKDHDRSARSFLLFGWGDGGGGPTPQMLETLTRLQDLQGVPRTRLSTSDEFFEALEAETDDWPVVRGELYFEYHRGTYTTQAATKSGNRRSELLLHDVEFLAAAADRLGRAPYPAEALTALWETLLTLQFHDILPGSSIGEVYEDAARDLAAIDERGRALRSAALAALVEGGDDDVPVNTLGVPRHEVAERPDGALAVVDAPSYGCGDFAMARDRVTVEPGPDGIVLVNRHLAATLGEDGTVRSLLHRGSGREALAGPANRLVLYDDRPVNWDAWDVDPFHLETGEDCAPAGAWRIARADDLRAEVVFERAIGARSRMVQTVRLDAEAVRLEVHCEVDWDEAHRLLRVHHPVSVRAANATFEMQFGVAERPTHYSTSHDLARFEVPGHRWADLSEPGFGVALLSDAKYGYAAHGEELRLTLLRAPAHPDPRADRGRHRFGYALFPHAGSWQEADVVGEGLRFNHPVQWARGRAGKRSWASVDDPALVLDTVKRAEDGDGLVLRLYEAHGGRGTARLRLGLPWSSARRCNLLEDDADAVPVEDGELVLPYRPFEIVSVRVR